jgi:hypothetical protein
MRKTLISLTSALTIAASAAIVPTPASAYPGWVIPAIAAAGVGGIALGAGISSAQAQTTGSIFSASQSPRFSPRSAMIPIQWSSRAAILPASAFVADGAVSRSAHSPLGWG